MPSTVLQLCIHVHFIKSNIADVFKACMHAMCSFPLGGLQKWGSWHIYAGCNAHPMLMSTSIAPHWSACTRPHAGLPVLRGAGLRVARPAGCKSAGPAAAGLTVRGHTATHHKTVNTTRKASKEKESVVGVVWWMDSGGFLFLFICFHPGDWERAAETSVFVQIKHGRYSQMTSALLPAVDLDLMRMAWQRNVAQAVPGF